MDVNFYARWAALGAFTAFWTITTVLVFNADVVAGVGGMIVGSLITARVCVGPGPPRKSNPSAVRARIERSENR